LVEVKDTTALGLFNTVKQQLTDHKLNMSDMIGFSADTTNVMFGEHNSIVEKLRRESPDCIFVKCVCHSIALAVSKVCATLPRTCEALVRDTYGYFSHSAKRKNSFNEFQQFTNSPQHNILKMYDIRWLSLNACVDRIIEQWEPLKLYFQGEYLVDRLLVSERLCASFNDPFSKLYLVFLSHVLSITNKFNVLFQSDFATVFKLYSDMTMTYKSLLSMYMCNPYIKMTKAKDLKPDFELQFVPLNQMYLGVKVAGLLCMDDISTDTVRVADCTGETNYFC